MLPWRQALSPPGVLPPAAVPRQRHGARLVRPVRLSDLWRVEAVRLLAPANSYDDWHAVACADLVVLGSGGDAAASPPPAIQDVGDRSGRRRRQSVGVRAAGGRDPERGHTLGSAEYHPARLVAVGELVRRAEARRPVCGGRSRRESSHRLLAAIVFSRGTAPTSRRRQAAGSATTATVVLK